MDSLDSLLSPVSSGLYILLWALRGTPAEDSISLLEMTDDRRNPNRESDRGLNKRGPAPGDLL